MSGGFNRISPPHKLPSTSGDSDRRYLCCSLRYAAIKKQVRTSIGIFFEITIVTCSTMVKIMTDCLLCIFRTDSILHVQHKSSTTKWSLSQLMRQRGIQLTEFCLSTVQKNVIFSLMHLSIEHIPLAPWLRICNELSMFVSRK